MPNASIIVPAYNVAHCITETLTSLLAQTYADFEIIVVDDGSKDQTLATIQKFNDTRIKIVRQTNHGLAGARNSGIAAASGEYIGFCDSDDLWVPTKLAKHVAHLEANPTVGLSFSASALIDGKGKFLGISQTPKLTEISAKDVLLRNPIGNGSSPVFRRAALQDIAWRSAHEKTRDWWFDENFRQTEDVECWMRFILTTCWEIEGLAEDLTLYRVNSTGLSASIEKQRESWENMIMKIASISPKFINLHVDQARAYQLRYLARRAVSMGQSRLAIRLMACSTLSSLHPLIYEPKKTITTVGAALIQWIFGQRTYAHIFRALTNHQH